MVNSYVMWFLIFVWMLINVCIAQSQRNTEGQRCTSNNGKQGICRTIGSCPSVVANIGVQQPVNCGFRGNTPIVCCPNAAPEVKPLGVDPALAKKKSEEKCREYSRSVTYVADILPLLPDAKPTSVESAKCKFAELPLIVGGESAKLGEFPHMAALGYRDHGGISWWCGGSLISDKYVLTAAHCLYGRVDPPVIVRLGDLNLKRDDDDANPQDYEIQSHVPHPYYIPSAKYFDIGLIRLKKSVYFNEDIRPACLYPGGNFYVNKSLATGWGITDFAEPQSDILMKVGLDIISNRHCNALYSSENGTKQLARGIDSTMVCATLLDGIGDACKGDSGGPLQIISQNNRCIYYVIGITSFGKTCGVSNASGVYTRVSSFLPWIVSVIWP